MSRRFDPARLGPPLVVLALSVVFVLWSRQYGEQGGLMPGLVGWVLIVLGLVDVIASSGTRLGDVLAGLFAGEIVGEAPPEAHPAGKAALAAAWVTGFVAAVYVFGFLPVIPVYVFVFVAVQGRLGLRTALLAAVAVTLFTWGVFQELMHYDVYRGLLFETYR